MRHVLILAVWVLTVAGAFYLGGRMREGGPTPAPIEDLTASENPRETPAPDPGPVLRPAPSSSRTPGSALADVADAGTRSEAETKPGVTVESLGDFDLEGVTDTEAAMAMILRHLAAYLAKGKEGHLDLLRFLNDELMESDDLKRLFQSDADGARILYPMIEFMVHRKDAVVDVMETVFETLAEEPEKFEGMDDNTLELFTEGAAFVLPGAVSEERLETFRGYAKKFLERDEKTLPKPASQVRRDVVRALRVWAPRLGPEEALARLKAGELQGPEALELIRRIPAEQLQGIDLAPYLATGVANGDWQTFRAMQNLPLTARDVAVLDQAVLDGATKRTVHEWTLRQYLQVTKRNGWPAPQDLIESGLRLTSKEARSPFAQVLGDLKPKPDQAYARWVLETYELPPQAQNDLKRSFGLR